MWTDITRWIVLRITFPSNSHSLQFHYELSQTQAPSYSAKVAGGAQRKEYKYVTFLLYCILLYNIVVYYHSYSTKVKSKDKQKLAIQ